MATDTFTGGVRPVTPINQFPPAAAGRMAARLLGLHSAREIAGAIEVLVEVLDLLGGDPDVEDATDAEDDHTLSPTALRYANPGAGCDVADAGENAWIEWQTMRGSQKRGPNIAHDHEDTEDDDPAEEDDHSGQVDEDGINTALGHFFGMGPGCSISDAAEYGDGRGTF